MITRENQKTITKNQNIDTQQSPGRIICRHLCDLLCPPKTIFIIPNCLLQKRSFGDTANHSNGCEQSIWERVSFQNRFFGRTQKVTIGGLRNAQIFIFHNVWTFHKSQRWSNKNVLKENYKGTFSSSQKADPAARRGSPVDCQGYTF